MSKEFLFNPDNPKKSFDVYIDKNPKDTIKKLEKLYKSGKYPHKRISQVSMIMMVRLKVMKDKKPKHYNLANRYFEFLKKRTKVKGEKERKKLIFNIV